MFTAQRTVVDTEERDCYTEEQSDAFRCTGEHNCYTEEHQPSVRTKSLNLSGVTFTVTMWYNNND